MQKQADFSTPVGRYRFLREQARWAERELGDRWEDVLHDTVEATERRIGNIELGKRSAYLKQAYRNRVLNEIRGRRRNVDITVSLEFSCYEASDATTHADIAVVSGRVDIVIDVEHALREATLSPKQREVTNAWLAENGERPETWRNADAVAFGKAQARIARWLERANALDASGPTSRSNEVDVHPGFERRSEPRWA